MLLSLLRLLTLPLRHKTRHKKMPQRQPNIRVGVKLSHRLNIELVKKLELQLEDFGNWL